MWASLHCLCKKKKRKPFCDVVLVYLFIRDRWKQMPSYFHGQLGNLQRKKGEMKDFWSIKTNQCLETEIFCYTFLSSFFEICIFLQKVVPSEVPKPTVDQTRMVMANGVPVNAWIGSHLQPNLVLLSLPSGIITRAAVDQSLPHSLKYFGVL